MNLLLLLLSCNKDKDTGLKESAPATCDPVAMQADAPPIVPGAPQAGVAESFLDLPVGLPLSGYTSRCICFGDEGDVDRRDSAYTYSFNASAGVQTRIPVKAFWLSNGDQDLVMLKLDVIYSYDGLVEEVEARLSEATGRSMDGKVVIATNHSHSSYGDYSDQVTYYLGSDRFNYEVFLRLAESMEDVAMAAHDSLQPAKLGMGYAKDWDPDDQVYHDRRGDNDGLQFFDDIPAGNYKDPYLAMLRIDTLDDQPLGVMFNFGMHGTYLGGDNAMISVEAPGHVELVFQERFDTPVVVGMFQSGAGDASPGGSDGGYAGLETVGEHAADAMYALWSSISTSAEPIRLETVSRAVPEGRDDIRITRNGATDLYYAPYDPELVADDQVYATDGSILSPIDEFNAPYGAAFCGEPVFPSAGLATVAPYSYCGDVEILMNLISGFFDLTEEERALPLRESVRAYVTAARLGPLPIRTADGTDVSEDVLLGFFPGEPTALYTEQFRRRAKEELGFSYVMPVGYAQDHEGYLLIPEDWLLGGYEPDINVWGPLQAEHIMEQLLNMAKEELLTDVVEHPDPCGLYQIPDYGPNALPEVQPEAAPEAGTLLDSPPTYLYSPLLSAEELEAGVLPDINVPTEIPRVQGIVQIAWIGGDPAVDFPEVTLERRDDSGDWAPVMTAAGRPVTGGPDILIATTPDPLYTHEVSQTHYWWASWQAIGHVQARTGVPEGTYRLHVAGHTYVGSSTTWPWDTAEYEVISPEFIVVPGALTVSVSGSDLYVSLLGPAYGYRLIEMDGYYRGSNPIDGDTATLTLTYADGSTTQEELTGSRTYGATVFSGVLGEGVVSATVEDMYGNTGTLTF